MCNLIHEEIISHTITGSQEDQVRSVLLPFLSSLIDETISSWAPIQKSDVAASTIAEEEEKEQEKVPSLPRYRTLPTLPPDQ